MRTYLLILFSLLVISSCKKPDYDATFRGQVVFSCDNTPVGGLRVTINQVDPHETKEIGVTTTDENGVYSLSANISDFGKYDGFELRTIGMTNDSIPAVPCFRGTIASSTKSSKTVIMNGSIPYCQNLIVHVKNAHPFSADDTFMWIAQVIYGKYDTTYSVISQDYLVGLIDTNLSYTTTETHPFYFNYAFKKNGLTTVKDTSVSVNPCYSTYTTDILY